MLFLMWLLLLLATPAAAGDTASFVVEGRRPER